MRHLSLLALTLGLSACGTQLDPGFTACGSSTCAPGNYCFMEQANLCEPGCTSNLNCLPGQTCFTDVTGTGTCEYTDTGSPSGDTGNPPSGDPLADCQAACNAFGGCGLSAAEVSECRSDCNGLSTDQQIAIGNCGEQNTCDGMLSCLGVDCFSDGDCGVDGYCIDYTCL